MRPSSVPVPPISLVITHCPLLHVPPGQALLLLENLHATLLVLSVPQSSVHGLSSEGQFFWAQLHPAASTNIVFEYRHLSYLSGTPSRSESAICAKTGSEATNMAKTTKNTNKIKCAPFFIGKTYSRIINI